MSIRILQIKACADCPYIHYGMKRNTCTKSGKEITTNHEYEIPKWCKLEAMKPEDVKAEPMWISEYGEHSLPALTANAFGKAIKAAMQAQFNADTAQYESEYHEAEEERQRWLAKAEELEAMK